MPSDAKPHWTSIFSERSKLAQHRSLYKTPAVLSCGSVTLHFQRYLQLEFFTMANVFNSVIKWVVPVTIAGSLAQASMYDVRGGTRAVIFDRLSGVKETVVNEGTHFLIPWLQKSIIYDVRTKPRNISTTTGSKDLQMVSLTLRVLHRPEVPNLPKIYQV